MTDRAKEYIKALSLDPDDFTSDDEDSDGNIYSYFSEWRAQSYLEKFYDEVYAIGRQEALAEVMEAVKRDLPHMAGYPSGDRVILLRGLELVLEKLGAK